jgi:anti-sigma factor RsiW
MSGSRDFSVQDIHLAIDDELPEEDRAAFDAWLSVHPDMAARAARYREDREALRAMGRIIADEPVPARHVGLVVAGNPQRLTATRRWAWMAIAASLLLAVGAAGGFVLARADVGGKPGPALLLADSAIQAHDIFAAEKRHVVEVGADQKDHLLRWLSNRLGIELAAPDLSAQGFHLVGGRLLPAASKSAAQFMYEDEAGNRISVYVARDPTNQDTGFQFVREGTTNAVYWLDEGYGCVVAGPVPQERLTAIADIAYKQVIRP